MNTYHQLVRIHWENAVRMYTTFNFIQKFDQNWSQSPSGTGVQGGTHSPHRAGQAFHVRLGISSSCYLICSGYSSLAVLRSCCRWTYPAAKFLFVTVFLGYKLIFLVRNHIIGKYKVLLFYFFCIQGRWGGNYIPHSYCFQNTGLRMWWF